MIKIAFFDTKPYEREWFERIGDDRGVQFRWLDSRLGRDTAVLADGCDAVCAFVNDDIDAEVLGALQHGGVRLVALRCAGYNNVDIAAAARLGLPVVRVPQYSPHAVAEHAMALLLTLNRKTHKAYIRTRDFNFSLSNLVGFDLYGKTAGVVGTGRIGRAFIDICRGFGMKVCASDLYPAKDADWEYVSVDELCRRSDIISLHCPLTRESHHLISRESIALMKPSAIIINTSRGELIDSEALLDALTNRRIGGACLDVFEEESDFFFSDCSDTVVRDETLALLLSLPNVIVSSHQAFLTVDALEAIARTTLDNIEGFFRDGSLPNAVAPPALPEVSAFSVTGR